MNGKINLRDLSALLAEKAVITKKEAETFLKVYFEIMNEELIKSKLLKIKDLGTFKLLPVGDRESIDVTTGERVLIPAHYRVTFTPDKKLAEKINEPFALFETIEIEEGIDSEDLELLSEEDTSKESEFILEDEPDLENESIVEDEPNLENESLLKKQAVESEEPDSNEESVPYWNKKSSCLNCHDFEAHRVYRKRYYKLRKILKRLRAIIFILSVLLAATLGYIVYIIQLENHVPFKKKLQAAGMTEPVSKEYTVSKDFGVLTDSLTLVENSSKEVVDEKILLPETSGKSKQITVVSGQRLMSIALEEYGDKAFWIYIYLENKAILSSPNRLPVGIKISIPSASKYGIDCNDSVSIQKAKELAAKNS